MLAVVSASGGIEVGACTKGKLRRGRRHATKFRSKKGDLDWHAPLAASLIEVLTGGQFSTALGCHRVTQCSSPAILPIALC